MAGEFLELLLRDDPVLRVRVGNAIQSAIQTSFEQDRSRITISETKRRFEIVEQSFRELRTDHGWAIDRILDALPTVLRCRLDGAPWDPKDFRSVWTPPTFTV